MNDQENQLIREATGQGRDFEESHDLELEEATPEVTMPRTEIAQQGETRAEHLAWCKRRALEYCDIGDVQQAFASIGSDLGKHPETANHVGIQLGMMMLMGGHLSTPEAMRKFIKGFN